MGLSISIHKEIAKARKEAIIVRNEKKMASFLGAYNHLKDCIFGKKTLNLNQFNFKRIFSIHTTLFFSPLVNYFPLERNLPATPVKIQISDKQKGIKRCPNENNVKDKAPGNATALTPLTPQSIWLIFLP